MRAVDFPSKHFKWAIIGPSGKRDLNGVSLVDGGPTLSAGWIARSIASPSRFHGWGEICVFRLRADGGPTLSAGLIACSIASSTGCHG